MTTQQLRKIIERASQQENLVKVLLTKFSYTGDDVFLDCRDEINWMLKKWQSQSFMTNDKAEICILLAERSVPTPQTFRGILDRAIRHLMPKYLSDAIFFREIGALDAKIPLPEVVRRFRKCQTFQNFSYVFLEKDNDFGWFKLASPVNVGNTQKMLSLTSLDDNSYTRMEPMAGMIKTMTFFQANPATIEFSRDYKKNGKGCFDLEKWVNTLRGNSLAKVSEEQIKRIIQLTCKQIDAGKTISGYRTLPMPMHQPYSPPQFQQQPLPQSPHTSIPQKVNDGMDPNTNFISCKHFRSLNQGVAQGIAIINENKSSSPNKKMGADIIGAEGFVADKDGQVQKAYVKMFKHLGVCNQVMLGSVITLEFPGGKQKKYFILGEGDADSTRGFISYKSDMAQALRGGICKSRVKLPGGQTATIVTIESLPPELIRELNCE